MERINLLFIIIIIIYFAYSLYKSKKDSSVAFQNYETAVEEKNSENEKKQMDYFLVTAVVAAIMDEKKYRIKKIYVKSTADEKKSRWKIAGLQEGMMKRNFFRKK